MKIARPEHTLSRLIFYEVFPSIGEAIARERQIKAAGARRTNAKLWGIEMAR
jgi:predicted GIY-YIG superfamily endonuclease